jgi:hypothetical protein
MLVFLILKVYHHAISGLDLEVLETMTMLLDMIGACSGICPMEFFLVLVLVNVGNTFAVYA